MKFIKYICKIISQGIPQKNNLYIIQLNSSRINIIIRNEKIPTINKHIILHINIILGNV